MIDGIARDRDAQSVAVIGATGAVGSNFVGHLLRSHLLRPDDALILVGHGDVQSDARLLAERIDLLDAFDEQQVRIRFCADPSQVDADIVVVAAGQTVSAEHPTRRDLAAANLPLFRHLADTCVSRLPNAIFIVVSNPVELAVEVFCQRISSRQVIGMGAQQDSLRFSRAVAEKLGLSRHEVSASVLGEHGAAMFPVWSNILLKDTCRQSLPRLQQIRMDCPLSNLNERVQQTRSQVALLLDNAQILEAYRLVLDAPPDERIFIEPFITAHVLHSTPNATSNATLQCVEAALGRLPRSLHGQVKAEGYMGVQGVCGLPILLSRTGWEAVEDYRLNDQEMERLRLCSASIDEALQSALKPVAAVASL